MLCPFALKAAQDFLNQLNVNLDVTTPDMRFSGVAAKNLRLRENSYIWLSLLCARQSSPNKSERITQMVSSSTIGNISWYISCSCRKHVARTQSQNRIGITTISRGDTNPVLGLSTSDTFPACAGDPPGYIPNCARGSQLGTTFGFVWRRLSSSYQGQPNV